MHGYDNVDGKNNLLKIRSDGRLEFNVRGVGAGFDDVVGTTVLAANTWYHVTLRSDGRRLILAQKYEQPAKNGRKWDVHQLVHGNNHE